VCDFGTTNAVEESTKGETSTGGSGSYSATENRNSPATTLSDTHSFATLVLECVMEKIPSEYSRDAEAVYPMISERKSPPQPDVPDPINSISDGLRALLMRCWSDDQPTMKDVHRFFCTSLDGTTPGKSSSTLKDPT